MQREHQPEPDNGPAWRLSADQGPVSREKPEPAAEPFAPDMASQCLMFCPRCGSTDTVAGEHCARCGMRRCIGCGG